MKTQNLTRTFQFAVCLLALWMAAACANKTNVAENEQVDGFAENGEKPADGATAENTDGAPLETAAQNGEASTEAELFGDNGAKLDTTAPTDPGAAPSTDPATGDPAMDSLFAANQDPAANAEPNFDELAKSGASGDLSKADGTTTPSTTPDPNADPLLAGGNTSNLQDPATPSTETTPTPGVTEKPSYAGAVVPNIPGRALTRKGATLNRYYFLRQGDTAKAVSQLIYGDTGKAASLKKWNKGSWMSGKVVYYTSPTQADDAQMISFYDERGLTPEEHKVGRGETMSSIAKKYLGSIASWKELAVVNGLTRPDSLTRGQTIKMYTNLNAGGATQVAASTPEPVSPPPIEQNSPTPVPVPVPVPEMAQVPPVVDAPAQAEDLSKPKKKPAKPSLNIGKLISQNSFALAMGLGIGLLVVALMIINKRKRGGGGADELGEDAFAAPEKKKRR